MSERLIQTKHECFKICLKSFFSPSRQKNNKTLRCKHPLVRNIHQGFLHELYLASLPFILATGQFFCLFVLSNHPEVFWATMQERFWGGVEQEGWKFTVHVKQLRWDLLPSRLLIKTLQCYVSHPHRVFLGTKVKFLFSWWNIDVVPCMCLEVELTM